jgi:hypothetical protein
LTTLRSQVETVLGQAWPEAHPRSRRHGLRGQQLAHHRGPARSAVSQAEIGYTEGHASGWLVDFAYFWLETYHSDALARMDKDWPRQARRGAYSHHERYLRRLLLGSEDLAPESLDWRLVQPGGSTLAYIADHLPAETWLELPAWFRRTLADHVRRWTRAGRPPLKFRCPARPEDMDTRLTSADWIARELWLRRHITAMEAVALTEVPAEEADRILASFCQPGFIEHELDGSG